MAKNSTTNNNMIVGLDIGTTKIATVVGYRNENGLIDVVGYGLSQSTGVEFGQILNINKTVEGISLSKNMATERSRQEISDVYVGIAGHHIKTSIYNHHMLRGGNKNPIGMEEIEALKNEVFDVTVPPGEEIIDVIPQRYIIDNNRISLDPIGEMGNEVNGTYQVITGQQSEVDKIRLCCEKSVLTPKDIILEPLASGISCLSEEEKKNGVVLVDIGGGTSDLIIFMDGKPVYTKVIPIGGNIVTRDIATVCQISEDLAEKLKIKHGTCIVDKSDSDNMITIPKPYGQEPIQIDENYLAQIINCRVQEEIINPIKEEIKRSGYEKRLFAGLVLTGGGSKLRHIKELCQYNMNLPTRIGIPEFGFSKTMSNDLKQPNYATALGLLKYGIEIEEGEFIASPNTNISDTSDNTGNKKNNNKGNNNLWGKFGKVREWLQNGLDRIS